MKMKAAIYEKYGPPEVLKIEEMEKPTPKENEVLIRIHAAQVTKYDCWMRSGTAPPGFGFLMRMASGIKPKIPILGLDISGEIEDVGKNVKLFKKGDEIFGFNAVGMSAYAEYICLPEDGTVAIKPASMTYEESVSVPYGALTSLYFLRMGNIKSGQKVLVFGASGGLGIFAVQLAKHFGAEVTGVCSTNKLELVKSLGADIVIDYNKEDYTKKNETYDVIFDTIGKSPFLWTKRSLKKDGIYICATFGLGRFFQIAWLKMISSKKAKSGLLVDKAEDLIFLRELIEAGKVKVKIDRIFPLDQISEAHRYAETGKKMGNVVISI